MGVEVTMGCPSLSPANAPCLPPIDTQEATSQTHATQSQPGRYCGTCCSEKLSVLGTSPDEQPPLYLFIYLLID